MRKPLCCVVLGTVLVATSSGAQTTQYGGARNDTPGNAQSGAQIGTQAGGQSGTPAVTLMPQSLTFPAIPAGSISETQRVTVTNSGTAPLHITNVQVDAGTRPGFASISSCVLPVAPGESCSIGVSFYPSLVGPRMAKLVITDDAPDSPQSVALSGMATVPYSIVATGAMTATVPAGGNAQFSLQLTPVAGFIGTVQLQCSGVPRGASCSVTPTTIGLSSRHPSDDTVQVMVMTAGGGGVGPTPPGMYTLTVVANWGLLSQKITLNLIVQ